MKLDKLDQVQDILMLLGYDVEGDGTAVQAKETPNDYVVIARRNGYFEVEVYDTPATILRDLGTIFSTAKAPANFRAKSRSTKVRRYGK